VTITPTAGGTAASNSGVATVVAPLTAVPVTFDPTHAVSFTGIVGSFTDPNSNTTTSSAFSISINWGDGTAASSGTASYNSSTKQWNVTAAHVYALKGTYCGCRLKLNLYSLALRSQLMQGSYPADEAHSINSHPAPAAGQRDLARGAP
jgi:hypothetical protein